MTVTVNGVNDDPWAGDDSYTTDENSLLEVAAPGLLANDSDPDASGVLTVSGVNTVGTRGMVTWNANGSFTYNPNGKFESLAVGKTALDTFRYTVRDGQGGTDTATVTVTVNGVNDAPVAADDAYATDEDTTLRVAVPGLLANDSDPDASDVLTVSGVDTSGMLGAVNWNGDGSFTYNPNGKFNELQAGDSARDSFTYTTRDGQGSVDTAWVTITVSGLPNNPPVANDDAYSIDKSILLIIAAPGLLANDSDPNPTDVLAVKSVDRDRHKGFGVGESKRQFRVRPAWGI